MLVPAGRHYHKHVAISVMALETKNGQRLHQFCTQENLTIGNTLFDKPAKHLWTHRNVNTGGEEHLRQLDYIMVGSKDKWRLQNVDTEDEMYIGNDHRTVTATFKIRRRQPRTEKMASAKQSQISSRGSPKTKITMPLP